MIVGGTKVENDWWVIFLFRKKEWRTSGRHLRNQCFNSPYSDFLISSLTSRLFIQVPASTSGNHEGHPHSRSRTLPGTRKTSPDPWTFHRHNSLGSRALESSHTWRPESSNRGRCWTPDHRGWMWSPTRQERRDTSRSGSGDDRVFRAQSRCCL